MDSAPKVSVLPGHFASKAELLAEIARDDLWPVTRQQDAFAAAPLHRHEVAVRLYVLAGTLLVEGGSTIPAVLAHAGARVDIPAGAVHTVSASGPVVTISAFTSSAATAGLPQLPVPEGG